MAVDSLNLSIAGKPYVASQTGDGKINLASSDGKDAQSMDIEQFKKYLAEHANEIKVAQPTGDTLETSTKPAEAAKPTFKGHGEEEKKGLTMGSKILIGAGVLALGVWKKDLVVKYWNKLFKKGAKDLTKEITKSLPSSETKLYKQYEQIRGAKETEKLDKEIKESILRTTKAPHTARQKELEEAFSAVA